MQVVCRYCTGEFDVDPSQAGNVVACPHPDCGQDVTIPLAAQVAEPLPPMERCYDCGRAVPEGEVCRRTVRVSTSYSFGGIRLGTSGSGKSFGRHSHTSGGYGGSSSTYAKVSLCPKCDALREAADRRAKRVLLILIIICFFVVAGLVTITWCQARVSAPNPLDALPPAPPAQKGVRAPPPANDPDPRPIPRPRGEEVHPPPAGDVPELLPAPKAVPTPEELAKDRERRAGLYLRAAREKLHDGYKRDALDILEEVVRKFPDTAAAKEARELWEKMDRD